MHLSRLTCPCIGDGGRMTDMSLYWTCLIYRVVTSLCDCGHVSLCDRHLLHINKSVKPWKECMSKQSILIKRNATSCTFCPPKIRCFFVRFLSPWHANFFHYIHNFTPFFFTYLWVLWLFFWPCYNFWRGFVRDFSNVYFNFFGHFQNLQPFFSPLSNFQSIFFSNHYYYVHFVLFWGMFFFGLFIFMPILVPFSSFLEMFFPPNFFFHFHPPNFFLIFFRIFLPHCLPMSFPCDLLPILSPNLRAHSGWAFAAFAGLAVSTWMFCGKKRFLSRILFDLYSQRLPCPMCQARWRICQRHRLWMCWWRCLWFANRCSRTFTLILPLLAPRKTCRSVCVNVFECKSSANMRVLFECEWLHVYTLNSKLLVLLRNEMVRELPLGVSSIVNIFHIGESECAGACSWEGVLVFRRNVIW